MSAERRYLQELIIAELGVPAGFDAAVEAERRVEFLADKLRTSGATSYVLGISGGVDSATAGRLCQLAVERVRGEGGQATFVAMRLPYGVQADEADAQRSLEFIKPDETLVVDVKPATDAMVESVRHAGLGEREDFHVGNIKARQRMVAQYVVAGARGGLVVGTDHAAEAVMGFYTKYGDGACDLTPLSGLSKRRVREVGAHLGAAPEITGKVPTADLETNNPGVPDEAVLGVTYDEIDDFLEGREVSDEAASKIIATHRRTAHKRVMPYAVD
ncbi:ammonia-dependent NAD(+) synthetase [Kribbella sandramycini]|uniref:NH(3)-dependent NAD(+) synthetase n=1 Tax=Kribbella sandramycini TaxID=60450 RepID=A0A7Y4L882_9ACTN|nr:ammonia-dependent NAD(+) synthetase [Kribbella sandramycini]MBB6565952.1 NAD+ synthase [Kribbella sandramycini]NOL44956.1 ammonia-dependent NAD(+) synthetase [Kribbella sandramycini]